MKLILCKGLPASGKSTWSKEYIKNNTNVVRVNRDEIREMLGLHPWNPSYENKVVVSGEREFIRGALKQGMDVIVDDTNLNPKVTEEWTNLGENLGAKVIVKEFDVTLEECIRRDSLREGSVGKKL